MSVLGQRNTVVVKVDGTEYEVGPDSADLDSNDSSRNLNDSYIHTEQYKAVFFGALHYIGEPVIDTLVVGLPLSNMQAAPKLKAMVVGKHKITDTMTVEVKDALVMPQPLGGLYYCLSQKDRNEELEFMDEEVNLIVDPGFLTFDFLLSNGQRVVENRSSAYNGGVSKVLRSIADSISAKFGIKYENLSAIDKGLRRRKIKINGQVEQLEEHIKNTRPIIEGSVNYMKNIVGDGSDIDNIILLGGGATVYKRTIETFFPNHKVHTMEESQTANVQGFQLAGEKAVK
jgi:plasmid segregation protein ParM